MLGLAAGIKSPLICIIVPGEGILCPILAEAVVEMPNVGTCSKVVSMTLYTAVPLSLLPAPLGKTSCQTYFISNEA